MVYQWYTKGCERLAATSKPIEAIEARITSGLDTDYELYKVINKKPGYSIYELAKEMGWTSGKVSGSVRRMEKEGLVHTQRKNRAGRTILKVYATDWFEFFTKKELEEFQKLEF
jgi:predicted transcriptional regulator